MASRTDGNGAAFAGSQLQTQLYVNRRTKELDAAICSQFAELEGARIEWRSPLAADRYREYSDGAFLERLDLGAHVEPLRAFWPRGGPHWDALALLHLPGSAKPGVLLVEGKSYPKELYSTGLAAEHPDSRLLIERSLGWTQQQLGVVGKTPQDWCGPLYQDANRLAHLSWMNSVGIETWLVHLLFTGDAGKRATSQEQWLEGLEEANATLGIAGLEITRAGHVLLPAGTYPALIG